MKTSEVNILQAEDTNMNTDSKYKFYLLRIATRKIQSCKSIQEVRDVLRDILGEDILSPNEKDKLPNEIAVIADKFNGQLSTALANLKGEHIDFSEFICYFRQYQRVSTPISFNKKKHQKLHPVETVRNQIKNVIKLIKDNALEDKANHTPSVAELLFAPCSSHSRERGRYIVIYKEAIKRIQELNSISDNLNRSDTASNNQNDIYPYVLSADLDYEMRKESIIWGDTYIAFYLILLSKFDLNVIYQVYRRVILLNSNSSIVYNYIFEPIRFPHLSSLYTDVFRHANYDSVLDKIDIKLFYIGYLKMLRALRREAISKYLEQIFYSKTTTCEEDTLVSNIIQAGNYAQEDADNYDLFLPMIRINRFTEEQFLSSEDLQENFEKYYTIVMENSNKQIRSAYTFFARYLEDNEYKHQYYKNIVADFRANELDKILYSEELFKAHREKSLEEWIDDCINDYDLEDKVKEAVIPFLFMYHSEKVRSQSKQMIYLFRLTSKALERGYLYNYLLSGSLAKHILNAIMSYISQEPDINNIHKLKKSIHLSFRKCYKPISDNNFEMSDSKELQEREEKIDKNVYMKKIYDAIENRLAKDLLRKLKDTDNDNYWN